MLGQRYKNIPKQSTVSEYFYNFVPNYIYNKVYNEGSNHTTRNTRKQY